MKRTFLIIGLALSLAGSVAVRAADTNLTPKGVATTRLDLDSFKLIMERNIFNPNRSASRSERPVTTRSESERRRPARTETFALVGTMSYEKGRYAFFDGSSSEFRKVLQAADTIAGYKIAEITTSHVRLEADGKAVELPVGTQMKKQDEGEWSLGGRVESSDSERVSSTSAGRTDSSSGGGDSEALRRLLAKRDQELGNGTPANPVEPPPPNLDPEKAESVPVPDAAPDAAADAILKRLMEKREQEQNK